MSASVPKAEMQTASQLADETTDGGVVISELGFDHYYRHLDIDK